MTDDDWLCGLKVAQSWNFTEAQYEEARKRIDSPSSANQLLAALIDVSIQETGVASGNQCSTLAGVTTNTTNTNTITSSTSSQQVVGLGDRTRFVSSESNNSIQESASSCYSSISMLPSSSSFDQSLESLQQPPLALKKIYIDGSNVARTHAKDASFSWTGIKLCVDWFRARCHRVKVFVPKDRSYHADESIISYLQKLDALVETPSGCNDDQFIIEAAMQNNGVIVSNDLYRDEKRFNAELQRFIYSNRLPYVFDDDLFLPAKDPLGRTGPTLDEFLRNLPQAKKSLCHTKSHQRYQPPAGRKLQALCRTKSHNV